MGNRANAALAMLVGAVVVLAVIAAVVVANRDAPVLDAGSPEGVVQAYLEAVMAGDEDKALDLVSTTSGCEPSDLSSAYLPEGLRVVVLGTEVDGDHAVVRVDVTENPGNGLFEESGWSHRERFSLRRTDGDWTIESSPWLLFGCTGEE